MTKILQSRLQSKERNAFARQYVRLLPGWVMIGYQQDGIKREGNQIALPVTAMGDFVGELLKTPVESSEFEKAKIDLQNEFNQPNAVDAWLDVETYKLASVKADQQNLQDTSLADVQRNAERWRKEPLAKILVLTKQPTDK